MKKEDWLLLRIEKLQDTRNYADEVESVRLTALIKKLMRELDALDQKR